MYDLEAQSFLVIDTLPGHGRTHQEGHRERFQRCFLSLICRIRNTVEEQMMLTKM